MGVILRAISKRDRYRHTIFRPASMIAAYFNAFNVFFCRTFTGSAANISFNTSDVIAPATASTPAAVSTRTSPRSNQSLKLDRKGQITNSLQVQGNVPTLENTGTIGNLSRRSFA